MKISREDLNESIDKYLKNGGSITKLPDGPNFRFQTYSVRVPSSMSVDTTASEKPFTKKQITHFKKSEV